MENQFNSMSSEASAPSNAHKQVIDPLSSPEATEAVEERVSDPPKVVKPTDHDQISTPADSRTT
jgi:hypothetical protein